MKDGPRVPVFCWLDCLTCAGSARMGDAPCWRCGGTGSRVELQTDETNPNPNRGAPRD